MAQFKKALELLTLLLLISYASFCALLFTPGLPQIASHFFISDTEIQGAMSFFLIGYTFGMLPYGPIANRFGRKKALLWGLGLSFIGTLICLWAPSFSMFCAGRFFQALGSAAGLKITFTRIGDLYQGEQATKTLATLTLAFGIMPGIGVAVGGFLTVAWGWQGCFAFLAIYTLLLIAISSFLSESARKLDPAALHFKNIIQGYLAQLKKPYIVLNAVMMGLATAIIYIFGTVAPIVSMRLIGISPDEFGLWNIIPSLGLVAGTLLARQIAGKQKVSSILLYGILLILFGTASMAFLFKQNWILPISFFMTMFFIQAGDNLFWIQSSSRGLSYASDKSNASAVMQFINIGFAAAGTFIAMNFSPLNPMLIPILFGIIVFFMLVVWGWACLYQRKAQIE